MHKTLKKILVTGASLLMFASVGAGMNNVQAKHHYIHTHRTYYYSGWRKGTPSAFNRRSYWVSNFLKDKYSKAYPYSRFTFPMNKNKGINLFNFAYKAKHSNGFPGSDTSAFAESYPYYEVLGHGKYLITCGDSGISYKHGHLYYDLKSNIYLVKMHGHNHLTLWTYDTSSKRHHKYYVGHYTKYTNKKQLEKVLRIKGNYL